MKEMLLCSLMKQESTGKHTRPFFLNTSKKEYILGVREMVDKSAYSCLDTLEEVVEDNNISSSSTAGSDILFNIKNTMSDRG